MPLETATYINQLVASNPAETDSEGQGADHLRLIKATLQATFPNVTGPVTRTQAQLNTPLPSGLMMHFAGDPGTTIMARGGTATGTEQFIECDGSSYVYTKFPGLAAFYGIGSGNITVPQLTDTNRFIRARSSSLAAGNFQSNQNASHTHTAIVFDPGHTHTATDSGHGHAGSTGSSGVSDPGHTHLFNTYAGVASSSPGASGGNSYVSSSQGGATTSSTTGITVSTTVAVATGTANVTNALNGTSISVSNTSVGGSEARPESFVAVCVIKT